MFELGKKVMGSRIEGVVLVDIRLEYFHIESDRKDFRRKIIPHTTGSAKERIFSVMRCTMPQPIDNKRMGC